MENKTLYNVDSYAFALLWNTRFQWFTCVILTPFASHKGMEIDKISSTVLCLYTRFHHHLSLLCYEINFMPTEERDMKKNSSAGSFSINLLLISLNPGKIFNMMGGNTYQVMFSNLLTALNQWWIVSLPSLELTLNNDNVHFSLFFGEILSISCNRKKCQFLCRTKVTYIKTCRITYNYRSALRSSRLIFVWDWLSICHKLI